jgi:hypothetical protein
MDENQEGKKKKGKKNIDTMGKHPRMNEKPRSEKRTKKKG